MKNAIALILITCICEISLATPAISYQSREDIQSSVIRYLESKLRHQNIDYRIELKPLDPRLKLQECEHPLEIIEPAGARDIGLTSVGVRCTAPKPWLIYTSAHIKHFRTVVIMAAPKERGSTISDRDVVLKSVEINRSHRSVFSSVEEVIGKIAKRPLFTDDVLSSEKLTQPKTIRRGEQVIILANNHGMDIRMSGAALMDGTRGQRISVRNTSSRRIIEGLVIAPGIVQVRY